MFGSVNRWAINVVIIVLLIATPVFTILFNLFEGAGDTWRHMVDTVLAGYVVNSLLLMFGVGALSLLLGVPAAWLVSVCDFPGRKIFEWALILPLAIPTYIMAYTYAGMLDYAGPVQAFLRNTLHITPNYALFDIMNIRGAMGIMALVLYPYVYVSARSSFLNQSATLLESSRMLGSSAFRTFFKVALPVSRPAIVGGLTLVVMEVLNDYGAVKYYGVSTFTSGIFRAWFSFGDLNAAIYLSALLLLLVFGLMSLERLQRGKARFEEASTNKPLRRYRLKGSKAGMAVAICLFPLALGFLFPLMQLIYWSWNTAAEVVDHDFWVMIRNSFGLAVGAALLVVVISVILIYSVRLNANFWVRSLAKTAVVGYSIPGAVIAVGVMIPMLGLDRLVSDWVERFFDIKMGLLLSSTLFTLLFAYLVRFLAVGYNPVDSAFKKQCGNLDEASRVLGVSPLKTLFRVNIPLVKGAMLSGSLLVFVDVLKELPLTLILRPFNFNTLATKAYELAGDELIAESSNVALIIIATGIVPIILLNTLISKSRKDEGTAN